MADIQVKDLTSIAGADLFSDSENFMRDLSDDELELHGGWTPVIITIGRTIAASTYSTVAYL
ncbi:hypothetical protein [Chamaesiphon polymorphus]|jgi:hypothetical protein|uniref:Bacteriocin n=1 Tax=Chamaesiphon polymorphus CCALA 037 TaxID=2107692 RepID=A0A2T1FIF4_9CYAN|nr:hypothetical protein [Chamaesiphon polymorphus]PSB44754.1 hypothetical protein C7B77_25515 [Chamaesiphon polymorphus CCALA 037]